MAFPIQAIHTQSNQSNFLWQSTVSSTALEADRMLQLLNILISEVMRPQRKAEPCTVCNAGRNPTEPPRQKQGFPFLL